MKKWIHKKSADKLEMVNKQALCFVSSLCEQQLVKILSATSTSTVYLQAPLKTLGGAQYWTFKSKINIFRLKTMEIRCIEIVELNQISLDRYKHTLLLKTT